MERPSNDTPPLNRAFILCRDSALSRLLEIELGLCGVTVVNRDDPYGLLLVDLDDHPELPPHLNGGAVICWSHRPPEPSLPLGTRVCFLHRPFALSELEACIYRLILPDGDESALRPFPAFPFPSPPEERTKKPKEAKEIHPHGNGIVSLHGQEISLTPREWALFTCLWERRGAVVPKALLRDALCAVCEEGTPATNTLEVYVCHLRRKLEKPSNRRLITTVRGQGYRLEL